MFKKLLQNKRKAGDKFSSYKKRDIRIHPDSILGQNTQIGSGTNINGPVFISSFEDAPVSIGKYCAIAYNLRIRTRNHYTGYINLQRKFQNRFQFPKLDSIKGPVTIGNNVWIGDNVTILSGVTIGDGAVLGAGSIVTKNIAPYSIAVGCPAKVIKNRFSDRIVEQLMHVQWWDWSDEKIKKNRRFFETDLSELPELDLRDLIAD